MNSLKSNPTGIDKAIELLQVPLYKELVKMNPNVKGFGRVYKNKKDAGFTLETLNGKEYRDVLGGEDSRFFFFMHNDLNGDTNVSVKVDVICMVKLTDFYSTVERQDEEFRTIVTKLIQRTGKFKLKKTVIGMEYIEGLISHNYQKANLSFSDMHPFHAVTFQTEVYYNRKTP